uniref:SFRICE_031954 n=1 Tax=Spodoptera frugiperda TaxID=7108 RepID=A0A2H1VS70_SPOFR
MKQKVRTQSEIERQRDHQVSFTNVRDSDDIWLQFSEETLAKRARFLKKSVSRSSVAFHNFLSIDIIYKQKQNINKLHPVYKYTFTRNEFPLKQVNNPRTRVPLTYYRSGTTILRLPSVSGSRNDQYTEVPRDIIRNRDITRRTNDRWGRKVLEWRPRTDKRSVGRPPTRWIEDLIKVAGSRWMQQKLRKRLNKTVNAMKLNCRYSPLDGGGSRFSDNIAPPHFASCYQVFTLHSVGKLPPTSLESSDFLRKLYTFDVLIA